MSPKTKLLTSCFSAAVAVWFVLPTVAEARPGLPGRPMPAVMPQVRPTPVPAGIQRARPMPGRPCTRPISQERRHCVPGHPLTPGSKALRHEIHERYERAVRSINLNQGDMIASVGGISSDSGMSLQDMMEQAYTNNVLRMVVIDGSTGRRSTIALPPLEDE
jgi:hypothetical protein